MPEVWWGSYLWIFPVLLMLSSHLCSGVRWREQDEMATWTITFLSKQTALAALEPLPLRKVLPTSPLIHLILDIPRACVLSRRHCHYWLCVRGETMSRECGPFQLGCPPPGVRSSKPLSEYILVRWAQAGGCQKFLNDDAPLGQYIGCWPMPSSRSGGRFSFRWSGACRDVIRGLAGHTHFKLLNSQMLNQPDISVFSTLILSNTHNPVPSGLAIRSFDGLFWHVVFNKGAVSSPKTFNGNISAWCQGAITVDSPCCVINPVCCLPLFCHCYSSRFFLDWYNLIWKVSKPLWDDMLVQMYLCWTPTDVSA